VPKTASLILITPTPFIAKAGTDASSDERKKGTNSNFFIFNPFMVVIFYSNYDKKHYLGS